ncbi:prolyl aminopeptidase [Neptunicella sp. SCSIO 80796]|uniref:prolyl aminopeptidase n=1 Tax=Neptunicella plasticusilytica TaxID=3117012 RepID=UPI003A4D75D8
MLKVYPPILPFNSFELNVCKLHSLHAEESGNPQGIPVIYLHGGPGGGIAPFARRLFNPELYRIINMDQRGCGQSRPFLELKDNHTQALIDDMETLRQHLGIDKWLVCGGSWGTTLALLYGMQFPDRVLGMVLRGVFLARAEDIDWFLAPDGGAAQIFPDHYQQFVSELERSDSSQAVLQHFHQQLTSDNEISRLAAAKLWTGWEAHIAHLHFIHTEQQDDNLHTQLSLAVLECHYMLNQCFIAENQILDNVDKMGEVPGIIVHGRYDMVCKLEAAQSLHNAWLNSELCIVPNAPHSGSHELIASAFCKATDAMARFLRKPPA